MRSVRPIDMKAGDVIRAPFTFTELSRSKTRPAMVLALAMMDDAMLAAWTGNPTLREAFDDA